MNSMPSVQNLPLPDVSGDQKVPLIGDIEFSMTSLLLHTFTIGSVDTQFNAPAGVGVAVYVDHFYFHFLLFRDDVFEPS